MNHGWHWETCPQCKGEGKVDVITGGGIGWGSDGSVTQSVTFTSRQDCACCDRCGRVKVPHGYHLEPNTKPLPVITTNRTTAVQP